MSYHAPSLFVLVSLTLACLISAALVPLVRGSFRRFGIVDKPDRERKLHAGAVSLGGGLAVFISVCLTFWLVQPTRWDLSPQAAVALQAAGSDQALIGTEALASGDGAFGTTPAASAPAPGDGASIAAPPLSSRWYILLGAGAVLMLVGLVDDAIALRGRQKLMLQILVVACVVGGGTVIRSIHCLGQELHLGIFAYPITALWLLAAINALNLIDGADGVASTAGAIISVGLALICAHGGDFIGATVAAALAGSLLGFLVYNRPPATIYLGDAGSMVIGLFVGVLSIWASARGSSLWTVAPLMVLALPLFDSAIAILRRGLTGRGIFAADRGHLHHRLLDRFSHPMMLFVVAGLCGITAAGAVLSVQLERSWIAVAGLLLALGLLVGFGWFGTAELRMLVSRASHFARSLFAWNHRCELLIHQRSIQLQGERCWEPVWQSLVEFACDRGLAQIKLDVAIAWKQEGYHASWRRVRMPAKADQACVRMPLFIDGRFIGRLEAVGDAQQAGMTSTLQLLIERCSDLDVEIRRLVEGGTIGGLPLQIEDPVGQPEHAFAPEVGPAAEHASLQVASSDS